MSALRAAVVGVGAADPQHWRQGGYRIGYTHASAYVRSQQVDLCYAADINPTNLEAFLKAFPGTSGYSSMQEMLEKGKPDIVSICTYVGLHMEMIEAAARAGVKGIFCEKPFLNSPSEIEKVRSIAEETGVKIVVAHIRRFLPAFRRAAELYCGGSLGKPVVAKIALGGWDLSEMGSHYYDYLRMVHGDSPALWAMGQLRVRETRGFGHAMEDHGLAYIGFANGGRGILEAGDDQHWAICMTGTAGSVWVEEEKRVRVFDRDGERVEDFADSDAWERCWDSSLARLVAWIEGGAEPEIGLTSALQTAELNLAAYVSALRGDRVDLPMSDGLDEWPVDALARRYVAQNGR